MGGGEAGSSKYLHPPPNVHSFPRSGWGGGKRWSLPCLHSCNTSSIHRSGGISLTWPLGTVVGRGACKRGGGLQRGRKGRGGGAACFLPLPLPKRRVEQLQGRESIAVQPQNKGAAHWLSYLLRTGILCWGGLLLSLGTRDPPPTHTHTKRVMVGRYSLKPKRSSPICSRDPGHLERVGENATGQKWGSPQTRGSGSWSTSTLPPEGLDTD